jgi:NADPH:quinone reductase-like Zn-dependent oxidoreductase
MSYKRVKIDQFGDPLSVLQLEQVSEIPSPANDEIVIKLIASPIHPSDLSFVQGIKSRNLAVICHN